MASPVHADKPCLPLTHEILGACVVHLYLETCPASLPRENSFWRTALLHDAVHVIVFSDHGDNPMIPYQAFDVPPLGKTMQ